MDRLFRRAVGLLLAATFAAPAFAQNTLSAYVDSDANPGTGCTITLPGGTFTGADARIDVAVTPGAAPTVAAPTRATCTGGIFGAPAAAGGTAAFGANTGAGAADVVEIGVPEASVRSALLPPFVPVGFAATAGQASDVLFPPGAGILFGTGPTAANPIPSLTLIGGVVLLIAVLLFARRAIRRSRLLLLSLFAVAGLAWAAGFVVDGQVPDWAGETLYTDPLGDPTNGQASIDIATGGAESENAQVFFRFDIRDLQNQPPVATPQSVTTNEDTAIQITLAGTDPEGANLTFAIAGPPTRGTLSAITPLTATTARVTYTPNLNANGADSFTFTVNDGQINSLPAAVSITITPVNDAPVVNAATFAVVEGSAAGTNVGTATATEVDTGQTLTWSITAGNTGNAFAINPATGQITVATAAAVTVANSPFSLTVQALDNGVPPLSGTGTITINVTGVNDAPSFTAGPNQTVAEDAPAQTVNPWATGISPGPPDEAGQTITFEITNNSMPSLFGAGPAVSPTGVLTYTPAANANGTATITLRVRDNGGTANGGVDVSPTQTFTITITAVNDAPVVTTSGAPANFMEGGAPVLADPNVTVTDVDSATLTGATVAITANFQAGADTLAFTPVGAITGVFAGNALTLSGSGTPAEYQTALRSVTFANSSQTPTTTARTLTWTATDGTATSAPATSTVTINNVDTPPTAVADTATVAEDALATPIPVLANDTDPDGGPIGIASVTQPANGIVVITGGAPGTGLTYQPNPNFCSVTPDTFTYTLTPGGSVGNVSVTVTCVDDTPAITLDADNSGGNAPNFSRNFTEGGGAVNITDTDTAVTDVDSVNLVSATVTITNLQDGAQESLAATPVGGIVATYTPGTGVLTLTGPSSLANYAATLASIQYNNTSATPGTVARSITVVGNDGTSNSPTVVSTITVNGVNTPPTLTAGGGPAPTFTEGGAPAVVDGGIVAADVDSPNLASATVVLTNRPDGDAFESLTANVGATGIIATYTAATGTLALTGPSSVANYQAVLRTVAYATTSDTPSVAPRVVTFVVNDGVAASNVVTVNVAVVAVNDPPVVTTTAGATTFTEAGGPVTIDAGVTVTDPDTSPLTGGATVRISANFQAGFDVLALPAPVGAITGVFAGDTLTLSGNGTPAEYQTALASVTFNNTSNAPKTAPRTITFVVNDGAAASAPATKTVNITAVNSPPIVDASGSLAYTEGSGAVALAPAATVSDPDSTNMSGATITFTLAYQTGEDVLAFANTPNITGVFNAGTGQLTLSGVDTVANYQAALRAVTYTNTSDAPDTTSAIVAFIVTDDTATSSVPSNRGIDITATNDAPVVTAGGNAAYIENAAPVQIDNTVTVTDVDSPNLASATASISAGFVAGDVLACGACGALTPNYVAPTLTLTGSASPAAYQAALRSVTFSSTSDAPGTSRTITWVANDGAASSAPVTSSITVTPVNDAPTFTPGGNITVDEDSGAFSAGWATAITDGGDGGQTLTFNVSNNNNALFTGGGQPAISPAGTLTFTPAPNAFGNATVTVTLQDNGGTANGGVDTSSPPVTFTLTVNPINDPPVADDETFSGVDGAIGNTAHVGNHPADGAPDPTGPQKTISGDILAGDTDIDGPGPLVLIAGTFATTNGGQVVLEADGDFTFHPEPGASCSDPQDSFNYTVSDQFTPTAGTDTGTVTITLSGCVWYLDDGAAAGGTGRSHEPFDALADINGAGDPDDVGHTLFLYDGSYGGGLALENTQTLFTQRHGLVVGGTTLEPAAGATTSTVAGGLVLANGNTVQGLDLGNAATFALSGTTVGTTTVNTVTGGTINNTTGGAVSINTGALNVVFSSISSSAGANGINLQAVSGTFTGSGGTLSNATGATVALSAGSSNFTYDGTINDDQGALVTIANETAGTKDFNGNVTDGGDGDGNGIALTNNTGATIRFDGGITLATGGNPAFAASGGGTVHVPDPAGAIDNTIVTTTGVALNVTNTTIGTDRLVFRSISAGTGGAGPARGITLNNTGVVGGLTVTGVGTTDGSGGTITDGGATMQRGIELINTRTVLLNNMTLTNASRVNGAISDGVVGGTENTDENGAIHLQQVLDVALTNVDIDGSVQHGINGNDVTNLDISNSTIQNAGDAVWESGVYLFDLKGTASAARTSVFSNLAVTNDSGQFNVAIFNDDGTNDRPAEKDRLEITNSQFTRNGANPLISDNVTVFNSGTGNFQAVVSGATFTATATCGAPAFTGACVSDNIQVDAGNNAAFDAVITTGNNFTAGNAGQAAVNISASGGGQGTFNVQNVTTSVRASIGINVALTTTNPAASLRGTIANNNLSTGVTNNAGVGIQMVLEGSGTMVVDVNNNTINGNGTNDFDYGIRGGARGTGNGVAEFQINNNNVPSAEVAGVWFFAGNASAGEASRTCVNFVSNLFDGDPVLSFTDYFVEMYTGTTFQIQGFPGPGNNATVVQNFISATDDDPAPADPTVDAGSGTIVNYSANNCQLP